MKKLTIIIPVKNKQLELKNTNNINTKLVDVIIEEGNNPSKNRNKGVKKAKTEFVAFINAHTILNDFWIDEVIYFFKKYPDFDIVGGPQLTPKKDSYFGKVSGFALSSKFGSANLVKRYASGEVNLNANENMLTSANLICKKKVFEKIKFDEDLYPGEDPKFIEDAKKNGFKVAYSPKIKVYNSRRNSLNRLIKQMYMYGKTRPKKESFLKTLKNPFFLIPSIFVIYLLLLPFLIFISYLFLLPFLTYIILNMLFSLIISVKNFDIPSCVLLFIIYPTIHLSYGTGFIVGLLKK